MLRMRSRLIIQLIRSITAQAIRHFYNLSGFIMEDLGNRIRRIEKAGKFIITEEPVEKIVQEVRELIHSKIMLLESEASLTNLDRYLKEIDDAIINKLAMSGNINQAYELEKSSKMMGALYRSLYNGTSD